MLIFDIQLFDDEMIENIDVDAMEFNAGIEFLAEPSGGFFSRPVLHRWELQQQKGDEEASEEREEHDREHPANDAVDAPVCKYSLHVPLAC